MKLKICGLKDPENIKEVAKLKPAYMGFIFYEGSKRFVGENFVMPEFSSEIKKTGVFVNAGAGYIIDKIDEYQLDAVQLHGNETPQFCEVFSHFTEVIKAFGMDEDFDFETLVAYKNTCHYFLFDTKTTEHGGSGRIFDRKILVKYKLDVPFFLSGGIGLEEMKELGIINYELKIFGVDVNSKFETRPGMKDIERLKKIILH